MKHVSKTDWSRVDKLLDRDLDYTDNPEITDDLINLMQFREPEKKGIYIKLDTDVIDFFKKNSAKYQVKINEVLKAYAEAVSKKIAH